LVAILLIAPLTTSKTANALVDVSSFITVNLAPPPLSILSPKSFVIIIADSTFDFLTFSDLAPVI